MTSSGRSRGSRARARCALVVITGEAGTGKSRLAGEFAASLPEEWSATAVTITRTGAALPVVPDVAAARAGRGRRPLPRPGRARRAARRRRASSRCSRSGSASTPRAAPRCARWPALVGARALRAAPDAAVAGRRRRDGGRDGALRGRGRVRAHGRQPVLGRAAARRHRGGALDGDGVGHRAPGRAARTARAGLACALAVADEALPATAGARLVESSTPRGRHSPTPVSSRTCPLPRWRCGTRSWARRCARGSGPASAPAGTRAWPRHWSSSRCRRTASPTTGRPPARPSARRASHATPPPTCARRERPGGRSTATRSPPAALRRIPRRPPRCTRRRP